MDSITMARDFLVVGTSLSRLSRIRVRGIELDRDPGSGDLGGEYGARMQRGAVEESSDCSM